MKTICDFSICYALNRSHLMQTGTLIQELHSLFFCVPMLFDRTSSAAQLNHKHGRHEQNSVRCR